MKTKVLEAIKLALEIKKTISLSELASITGYKKLDVLQEIAKNKSLLNLDKNGKILGFINIRDRQLSKKIASGEVYYTNLINYGSDTELVWNHENAKNFKQCYWEGGFGDCRRIDVILDTEENRKKIEAFGAVFITEAKTETIDFFWEK